MQDHNPVVGYIKASFLATLIDGCISLGSAEENVGHELEFLAAAFLLDGLIRICNTLHFAYADEVFKVGVYFPEESFRILEVEIKRVARHDVQLCSFETGAILPIWNLLEGWIPFEASEIGIESEEVVRDG